jgi:hypothetical protein
MAYDRIMREVPDEDRAGEDGMQVIITVEHEMVHVSTWNADTLNQVALTEAETQELIAILQRLVATVGPPAGTTS